MRLFCDANECRYRDAITGVCTFEGDVNVWDFYEFDSEDWPCFASVLYLPEYQSEFWIACRVNGAGIEYRQKKHGKRCEANGVVFYVHEPLPSPERWPEAKDIECTEEETGMKFPLNRLFDEAGLAAIRNIIEIRLPVMELPECDELEEELSIDE